MGGEGIKTLNERNSFYGMQHTCITSKNEFYFIGYYFKTVKGFIIYDGTYEKVQKDASPTILIEAINNVLNSFRVGILQPEWKDLERIYKSNIKKFGFKTEKEFNRGAIHCGISLENEILEFLPSVNDGRGFAHRPKLIVAINSSEPVEKIYAALMEALSRCE